MRLRDVIIPLMLLLLMVKPFSLEGQQTSSGLSVTVHRLKLSFNEQTRTFELFDANEGLIISAGMFRTEVNGKSISTDMHEIKYQVKDSDEGTLSIEFDEYLTVKAVLSGDSTLTFFTEGKDAESVRFTARAPLSHRTLACYLLEQKAMDNHTIVQTLGAANLPGVKSIFDPLKDLAIQIESESIAKWDFFHQWQMTARAKHGQMLCKIKLIRNYYKERLGIRYYAPIKKRSYFQKAPALAMTWVGIEGKFNRPDFSQRKEWLYPNIDWVSENLLPYAGEMIFQLDDNYPIDDPQYMRDISDYIRSRGLIPGIWLAPFGVAPFEESEMHPEWFIHKKDGSTITTFSGLSYDDIKHYNSAVLNVNNKEAVDIWFAGFISQLSETWNYDYFKMDGIPAILNVYQQSVDGGGVEGVRRGLQIIRSVVGPDKYINTCWGLPLEGIDIVNGSRVGGDTEQEGQVVSSVAVAQNYLNNIAWYSDPDGAANMYASSTARARLNFQGRTLLGQPYVTDDNWTKVPDHILQVWQKTLPTIESFPINLYPISDPGLYDHFDLKISKPWGDWDIVGLNNYENQQRRLSLDLGRLPLIADELYLYDFWNQKYLGTFSKDDTIVRNMEALDAHCFSLVPVRTDRPVLLSTSRHITQGGIDIDKMSILGNKDGWTISGESRQLIKDDPYELVFVSNGFVLDKASAQNGSITILSKAGICRVRIMPDRPELSWNLSFIPDREISVGFDAEAVHLIPGQAIDVPIAISKGGSAHWKVKSSNKNIRLKEDHSRSLLSINIDGDIVESGGWWSGLLTIESKDAEVHNSKLVIEVMGEARQNIALQSKATASSVYFHGDQNGYGRPGGANDGLTFKAWEAAEGKSDGWIELTWEKPVEFQRIVIDEWLESGGEIESWTLEAGYKKHEPESESMEVIARGETIGRGFVIELDEPLSANVLTLTINKASKRPGVWEIEVNPVK